MYNISQNGKVVLNDFTYLVITKEKTPTIFRQKHILTIKCKGILPVVFVIVATYLTHHIRKEWLNLA